jgi:hypothetical protein
MLEQAYYQRRMAELGLSSDQNLVPLWLPTVEEVTYSPLLSSDNTRQDNLVILYLALQKVNGAYVPLTFEGNVFNTYTQQEEKRTLIYYSTRLQRPSGKVKYKNPAHTPAQPFLPPLLIEAFVAQQPIDTLVIVEGALKALKATLHGLYCIGTNGIWGMRGTKSPELHPFILQVIQICRVKHLVYLHDNDCRQISFDSYKDLAERPKSFAQAVIGFQKAAKLLKDQEVKSYYAHVLETHPKGLDDLLIAHPGREADVCADLLRFTAATAFFAVKDLQTDFVNLSDIKQYFYLDSAATFYDHHSGLIGNREFLFEGDRYVFNEDKGELECLLPGIVLDYVLVANKYYKLIYEPNSKGLPELVRDVRLKGMIEDQFKRQGMKNTEELILKIPHYEGYANEPDFIQYQKEIIVRDRFRMLNLAYPLEHQPQEGEWTHIEGFLRHIFHNGGDSKYEVGLDMIQLYYRQPKQKQRILSLVSQGNETGKSTFIFLLREIFGQNMSIIGNTDFKSQFNGYVTKSLVAVDESKIDDIAVIEAIKSMVTSPYAMLNEKGVSSKQVINHVKLIMTTNHIFDFASIREEENKWFVIEVGKIGQKNKELMDLMRQEIPAFLHFLLHRELKYYTRESRFAIPDAVIETEALKRIKLSSQSQIVSMIQNYITGIFEDFEIETFKVDALRLYQGLFPEKTGKYSNYDVEKVLKEEFKLKPSVKSEYFKLPTYEIQEEEQVIPDTGEIITPVVKTIWKGYTGKVYTFLRTDKLG